MGFSTVPIFQRPLLAAALCASILDVPAAPPAAVVRVDAATTLREHDRTRLLGTNAGLWYEPQDLSHPVLIEQIKAWGPATIRMPGGSWTNEIYWNGNGVRDGQSFNAEKFHDGFWEIDHSAYAPGFRIRKDNRQPADYHGAVDVIGLHEFIGSTGARAQVAVNLGTGTPGLAAEWVRWANKTRGYGVTHWEIGNEPEGDWEAGNLMRDGKRMTGEIYAQKFLEFARAMKAADPSIKVGGPVSSNRQLAFGEELVRIAGSQLDFFSFHTYPVEKPTATLREAMTLAREIGTTTARIRGWLEKYVPDRKEAVEIGITEWHYKVVEDEPTAGMTSALWSAVFIGEMFKAGVDFANQWDLFSVADGGGHALFLRKENMTPLAQYWAMRLWGNHMQNRAVSTSVDDGEDLWAMATRSEDRLSVMLVNYSADKELPVRVELEGFRPKQARRVLFSPSEYTWNPHTRRPAWSREPEIEPLADSDMTGTIVPAMSIVVLEYASTDGAFPPVPAAGRGPLDLELSIPQECAADLPVDALVMLRAPSRHGGATVPARVKLEIEGPARATQNELLVHNGSARFPITLTGPGEVKVKASTSEGLQAEATLKALKVDEREEVYWRFDGTPSEWGLASTYSLAASDQAKPNQNVAMITLDGATAEQNKDLLLHAEPLPKDIPKDRIGGVVFKAKRSSDFTAPPGTAIGIVMQSEANHWIPVARIPMTDLGAEWKEFRFPLTSPPDILAMPQAYSLRLQLVGDKPVTGKIYIDDLGFILRGASSK